MVRRVDWLEREFSFDHLSVGMLPFLIERLRSAPAPAADHVRLLQPETLTRRDGKDWSIQEHVGHLLDLESLGAGRMDDFQASRPVLRPADMTNRATEQAGHNAKPIEAVLKAFRTAREEFVRRLEACDEAFASRRAVHPRLEKEMRVVDLAYFVAEHDAYHLAIISELIRKFGDGARDS